VRYINSSEETLRCPFCESDLTFYPASRDQYYCTDEYCPAKNELVVKDFITCLNLVKQKSFIKGYEKGREDERKEAEKDLAFCRREHLEAIKFYEEKLKELEKNG
jgi:hypothetical protein